MNDASEIWFAELWGKAEADAEAFARESAAIAVRDVAQSAAHWRTRAYVRHAEDNTRTWTRPKAEQEKAILHDASGLLFEDFGGFAVVLANPNWRAISRRALARTRRVKSPPA
jgi:hypothetical protein